MCAWCNKNISDVSRCPRLSEIETVRFSELLKKVKFGDVFASICKWTPDQDQSFEGYKEVFNKIRKMVPQKHDITDLFINVDLVKDDEFGDWLNVTGETFDKKKNYGIEFCPWKEWVSMFVTQKTLDTLTPEDIVGACLYEMTFYGFNEETVEEQEKKIYDAVEECKRQCA